MVMSLVERLYKIARSRLDAFRHPHQHTPGFDIPFQDRHSQQEKDWHDPRENSGYQQSGSQQSKQDSKLAAYYANLELPYGASLEEVRTAWKRLMRQYHPDRHSQDPEKRKIAEQLTQGLNEAFHALEKHLQNKN
jgi:DnaJ-domain-containing protein 1